MVDIEEGLDTLLYLKTQGLGILRSSIVQSKGILSRSGRHNFSEHSVKRHPTVYSWPDKAAGYTAFWPSTPAVQDFKIYARQLEHPDPDHRGGQ
jgi:hypothetical protein